jgi:hypothetical protein
VSAYRDGKRDPALEAEHRDDRSPSDAGHLVMPDGSLVASGDPAFLNAAAPYVVAAHLAARDQCQGVFCSSPGAS